MNLKNLLAFFTLSLIAFSSYACSVQSGQTSQQQQALPVNSSSVKSTQQSASFNSANSIYINEVREKFNQQQFSWLEEEAQKVRERKERLLGGYWKLNLFYIGVAEIDDSASDAEWQQHLALLRKWVEQEPKSVTARVGLAEGLINYGWSARGGGYSNTVSEESWKLFAERLAEAKQVLDSARSLPEKCPHWYVSMMRVEQSIGVDSQVFNQIFDEAVKMEPDYYYYYRAKAIYLMPRWHGQPGDWEKFAQESAHQIGGERGDMMFFLIYTNMLSQHDLNFMSAHHDAWPQLLAGFRALEKRFGASPERLNEACLMAVTVQDIPVANELFKRIGDKVELEVWGSRQKFEVFHSFALERAKA